MIKKAPIKFLPYLKSVIWGGNKICKYKGIAQNEPNIGESWEISAVPGHESVVAEGEYKGENLVELISKYGSELLGESVAKRYDNKFPLLIKFIDANDNLSVQVHPDDKLAQERHGCLGKTEMWYILDTEKDAKIYAGLNRKVTPDDYVKLVENGEFQDLLAVHDSFPGDLFFLPAGRVHAIGAGNLLLEIQESSDITYRIYDYDRRDANGNTRELHTELAKGAIDFEVYDNYKSDPAPADVKEVELVKCDHFVTDRLIIDGSADLKFDGESFNVVICFEGEVNIVCEEGTTPVKAGESVLLPAVLTEVKLEGKGTVITTHC